jgi:hypothetical protein
MSFISLFYGVQQRATKTASAALRQLRLRAER